MKADVKEDLARAYAQLAESLERRGDAAGGAEARRLADRLGAWELELRERVGGVLALHHDMSNALTGVLGNAQLLLMGPAAQDPKVRRRLEMLQREAERLREMAERLRDARYELNEDVPPKEGEDR